MVRLLSEAVDESEISGILPAVVLRACGTS